MILPDQTPKLPKWPFLVADAALLAAAWFIGANAAQPLRTHAVLAIAACVAAAAVAGAIPFLADYARRQDEALDNRQRALEALARNTTSAAEQISIAAAALHDMATAARKGWNDAAELPAKLREQAAEAAAQAARTRAEDRKALEKESAALRAAASEKLQAAADKVVEAALARVATAPLPTAAPAPVAVSPVPPPKEEPATQVVAAPASAERNAPERRVYGDSVASAATGAQATPKDELLPNLTVDQPAAEVPAPEAPSGGSEAPKPAPRKRAPKKPAPVEEARPEPKAPIGDARPEPEAAAASVSEFTQPAPDEVAPSASIAADGASRLLVTAYIGIGNRLFIRGEGPGLSWERGVPLQFVSIGKWRWDTNEATAPIRFKLYKNDEIECAALGTNSLDPGRQVEVTASFNS